MRYRVCPVPPALSRPEDPRTTRRTDADADHCGPDRGRIHLLRQCLDGCPLVPAAGLLRSVPDREPGQDRDLPGRFRRHVPRRLLRHPDCLPCAAGVRPRLGNPGQPEPLPGPARTDPPRRDGRPSHPLRPVRRQRRRQPVAESAPVPEPGALRPERSAVRARHQLLPHDPAVPRLRHRVPHQRHRRRRPCRHPDALPLRQHPDHGTRHLHQPRRADPPGCHGRRLPGADGRSTSGWTATPPCRTTAGAGPVRCTRT